MVDGCVCVWFSQVSDTYPAELYVPESATQQVIVGSSKFRSRGRFPTLSYYCKDNQVRHTVGPISYIFISIDIQV